MAVAHDRMIALTAPLAPRTPRAPRAPGQPLGDAQAHRAWVHRVLARYLRPCARLTVSEWADAHRILSPKASSVPGRWRTERNPVLRAITDDLSDDSPVETVVVMKSSQVGVTEVGLNWIGYVMDHIRTSKPMLVVLSTQPLRTEWVRQRLDPLIEATPELARLIAIGRTRDGGNREDRKS